VRELTARRGNRADLRRGQDRARDRRGGATERYGVTPDMVTLAKTSVAGSGGCGRGTRGDERRGGRHVYQVGTYNGNPLTMPPPGQPRAGADADAYRHLDALNDRIVSAATR